MYNYIKYKFLNQAILLMTENERFNLRIWIFRLELFKSCSKSQQ